MSAEQRIATDRDPRRRLGDSSQVVGAAFGACLADPADGDRVRLGGPLAHEALGGRDVAVRADPDQAVVPAAERHPLVEVPIVALQGDVDDGREIPCRHAPRLLFASCRRA